MRSVPRHRSIVAIDIERSTSPERTNPIREELRHEAYRMLGTALRTAGITDVYCDPLADRGDGQVPRHQGADGGPRHQGHPPGRGGPAPVPAVRVPARLHRPPVPEDERLPPAGLVTSALDVLACGEIEIEVSGARIRVEPGVDATTLSTVLSALRGWA